MGRFHTPAAQKEHPAPQPALAQDATLELG